MNKIFEIKNLQCKYKSNAQPVLVIDELNIEEGSNTFFIGSSGVGKSTILETLGLMNNTIYNPGENDTIFNFINPKSNKALSIAELWEKRESEIADFRNEHLSFIFQNTNLFKTLSAFDNISISAILQGDSKNEAIRKTKEIVKRILPDVEADKPITELSGGQRQRIAFARAIVSDFTVLFADEPTGNLDMGNAEKLMNVLFKNTQSKTAIIVTHDIKLAIKHATQIVLIQKQDNGKGKFGLIDSSSIYKKSENRRWSCKGKSLNDEELFRKFEQEININ